MGKGSRVRDERAQNNTEVSANRLSKKQIIRLQEKKKRQKKFITWGITAVIAIAVVAVVFLKPTEKNVEGTLEEIMAKVYAGISEENLPMMLGNIEVNSENVEGFLGTVNVEYKEALASESMVGSIAHSVVLVRVDDASKTATIVQTIKDSVNPRKWICVEASNVVVKEKGNLVILIMSNEELAPKLEANFDNL
jgi:hypothetical protein